MMIGIKNQIIMLDEAHNIEDICRRSASIQDQQGELRNLQEAMAEMNQFMNKGNQMNQSLGEMKDFVEDVIDFLEHNMIPVEVDKNFKSDQYTVIELDRLTEEQKIKLWLDHIAKTERIMIAWHEFEEQCKTTKTDIPGRVKTILDGFCRVYGYIKENPKNMSTMRVLIRKEEYNEKTHSRLVKTNKKSRWAGDHPLPDPEFYHELQIICMSPAVAFNEFRTCHSVLLASGTLSPLETFEAELGVEFKHKVEANHVIRPEQVFCRHISTGPSDSPIRAVYSNRDNENMLTEVGRLLLNSVENLKQGGVLIFFTSYATLKNHVFTWKKRKYKLWNQLEDEADLFLENEVKGAAEFNNMLSKVGIFR